MRQVMPGAANRISPSAGGWVTIAVIGALLAAAVGTLLITAAGALLAAGAETPTGCCDVAELLTVVTVVPPAFGCPCGTLLLVFVCG